LLDPRHAFDAGGGDVPAVEAHERVAALCAGAAHHLAESSVDGEQVVGQPQREAVVDKAEGRDAGVAAGQVCPAGRGELDGDLDARVAGADHEHVAGLGQLSGVAVVAGVQLGDRGVERRREPGDLGVPVGSGGDHGVVGQVSLVAGGDQVAVVVRGQCVDVATEADGEPECRCVGLEVVGGFVLGGEVAAWWG
jgi:hypothetical protein